MCVMDLCAFILHFFLHYLIGVYLQQTHYTDYLTVVTGLIAEVVLLLFICHAELHSKTCLNDEVVISLCIIWRGVHLSANLFHDMPGTIPLMW